jgi:hypothetical protein
MVPEMMLEYEKRSNVGYLLNVVEQRLKKSLDIKPKTVVLQPPVTPTPILIPTPTPPPISTTKTKNQESS